MSRLNLAAPLAPALAAALAVACLLAIGCRSSGQAQPAAGEPERTSSPAAAKAKVSPESEPRFTLEALPPERGAGAASELVFEVRAGEGWKINAEYPNRAKLVATTNLKAVSSPPAFEVNHTVLTGRIPVTVDGAGPSGAKAALSFALCDATRCLPLKRELHWRFESP